jgi:hypothetical protein
MILPVKDANMLRAIFSKIPLNELDEVKAQLEG